MVIGAANGLNLHSHPLKQGNFEYKSKNEQTFDSVRNTGTHQAVTARANLIGPRGPQGPAGPDRAVTNVHEQQAKDGLGIHEIAANVNGLTIDPATGKPKDPDANRKKEDDFGGAFPTAAVDAMRTAQAVGDVYRERNLI